MAKKQKTEEVQLDYDMLLLRHIDRMSILSSKDVGVQYDNNKMVDKENDKFRAFVWQLKFLNALVPKMHRNYGEILDNQEISYYNEMLIKILDVLGENGYLYDLIGNGTFSLG